MEKPFVVKDDPQYVVLYKPEKMHSAPLKEHEDGTLLDFCGRLFPEVLSLLGKKKGEGGLLHRLDFETQGLVLFARNQRSLDHFLLAQHNGLFLKRYAANVSEIAVSEMRTSMSGFPVPPEHEDAPFEIRSAFRPFGPGRKAVRPVLFDHLPKGKDIAFDQGGPYVTAVLARRQRESKGAQAEVSVAIRRGFRHQIRSHLAWLGFPIVNDDLYGGAETADKTLALKAVSLSFPYPETQEIVEISL